MSLCRVARPLFSFYIRTGKRVSIVLIDTDLSNSKGLLAGENDEMPTLFSRPNKAIRQRKTICWLPRASSIHESCVAGIEVEMDYLSKLTKDGLSEWLQERSIPQDVVEGFRGNKLVC